jgi:hypothetical protein
MAMPRQPKRQRSVASEYRFRIDAYTPDTIPMGRLAEYMAELSKMLGERDAVHFRRLESGSTILVHRIEREAMPKVRARITKVRTGDGPTDAVRAYNVINKMLRDDNAAGVLREKKRGAIIIRFPGREEAQEGFASVRQYGSIDGIVTWVGGSDETTAHVTLETEGRQISHINTTRPIAKALGGKLFEAVRLHGRGRWSRDSDGNWSLRDFRAESFEPLVDAPLSDVLSQMREGIPTQWMGDAYGDLGTIRHGLQGKGKRNGGH